MNFSFCIRELAVAFYMINEIQPKIKFQNIVQCPFKHGWQILCMLYECVKGSNQFKEIYANVYWEVAEALETEIPRYYLIYHYIQRPLQVLNLIFLQSQW